jgi:hypothetical protein
MTRTAAISFSVIVSLPLLGAAPTSADDGQPGAMLTGQFLVGYRSVSVDGQDSKYMEDYNLQKGPRLFNLNLVFKPDQQLRGFADRVQLDVDNYGGDPFETLHLGVEKYGAYDFRYTRTKDTYFYSDIILPEELANSRSETGGDFRTFNYEHVRDLGRLDVTVSKAAKLHFNFDRFTRLGTSTLPEDFARDGYVFTKPVDESQNRYGVGLDYTWRKVTLALDENVRDYQNVVDLFLPGASRGADPSNTDMVDDYFLNQPYDYKSYDHTARLVAHPNKRWIIEASALLQRLDLNVSADQRQEGTDFNGQPLLPAEVSGAGSISRDSDILDLSTTYMFNDRVGVLAAAWHKKLKQDGDLLFGDAVNEGRWNLETNGGRTGVELDFASQVTVTAGIQYEHRKVNAAYTETSADLESHPTVTTRDTGFFGTVGWVPRRGVHLTAELEDASYTDPYTLKSPTDRQRVRVRGQYKLESGLYLSGSFLYNKFKNDDSGWDAHYNEGNLRLGYQKGAVTAAAGYGRIDISRNVSQEVDVVDTTNLLFLVPIAYDAKTDLWDGELRWAVDKEWAVGGDLRYYSNSGSWPLAHDDLRGYVEYTFTGGYVVHAGYRYVKYDEKQYNFDDYSANIGEFSVGYRW